MSIKIQVIGGDALEKIGKLSSENRENLMQNLVTESKRFGLNAVAIAKKEYLSGPRPDKLGVGTGRLRSSLATKTERSGSVVSTTIGSDVVYAPIHEFGGTVKPSVTERMRKFMWFMFYKTGDEKFKWTALTSRGRLSIKIPARPFLRPALQDAMPTFEANIAAVLGKLNFMAGS